MQSSSVQGGDDGTYLAALYHFRGREERVVFPRTEQEFRELVASGTRTMMLTRQQVKEWDAKIDVREVPEGHSLELVFADDDEFYESLVFDTLDAHTWIWSDLHRQVLPPMFDPEQLHDPEFRTRVQAARMLIAERVRRGVASTRCPTRTTPTQCGRGRPRPPPLGGRSAALATLALYVGIVETLADGADRDDGDDGETMH